MARTKKPRSTGPDVVAVQREHAYTMTRPVLPRRQTLLNTTRVQGRASKGTTNMELGMYVMPKPAELRELDAIAHRFDGHWLPVPRLIKRMN